MNIVWMSFKDADHPQAGGAEVVNEELAARLSQDGHTVTFLTSRFAGAAGGVERRGFTIIRTGGRYTTYLTTMRFFIKHRRQLNADLVIDECNTIAYMAGWYSRVKTVSFFHMLCRKIWFYEFPRGLSTIGYVLEPLMLLLLRPKSPVITVSESTKQDLMNFRIKPEAIAIISEGITLTPAADLTSVAKFDQPTLLIHGGIRPMKRTLEAVQAFELAKGRNPALRLIISGDAPGKYGQLVLDYVAASRFASSIHYAGRVSEQAKVKLMARAHAVLVTSVKEGWCLVVTECASQGTPAVVYDTDGLRDSVKAGVTGLIASENTPAGLSASINQLLSDPERYEDLRRAGWEWSKTMTFDHSYQDFKRALEL